MLSPTLIEVGDCSTLGLTSEASSPETIRAANEVHVWKENSICLLKSAFTIESFDTCKGAFQSELVCDFSMYKILAVSAKTLLISLVSRCVLAITQDAV